MLSALTPITVNNLLGSALLPPGVGPTPTPICSYQTFFCNAANDTFQSQYAVMILTITCRGVEEKSEDAPNSDHDQPNFWLKPFLQYDAK